MKQRSSLSVLAIVILALLALGVAGFYWLTNHSPLKVLHQRTNPAAMIFIPKQAPIVASLLVHPDDLKALSQVIPSAQRRQVESELMQLPETWLKGVNLNYQEDLQPWLGDEITTAVLSADFDRDLRNGQQPGYLVVMTTRDADRSREFLQLYWQKRAIAGEDLVFEQYQGVKLIYANSLADSPALSTQSKPSQGLQPVTSLATAAVGNQFVLFANHPKVLREAINTVQAAELALANTSMYQMAISQLTQDRLGLVYVNLPQLFGWINQRDPATLTGLSYDGVMIAPGIVGQGLGSETIWLTAAERAVAELPTSTQVTKPVQALKFIPSNSALVAAGADLQQLWQHLEETVPGYGLVADRIAQQLSTLKQRQHLDLPADIFSWVQGEYALGMLLPPGQAEPDWIFVAQRSVETDAAIGHLDDIAKQRGFSAGPLSLGEQPVSAWTRLVAGKAQPKASAGLEAQIQGMHVTLEGYEVFASSVNAMTAALQSSKTSLLNLPAFVQATTQLPQPNHGYLYLDWGRSQPILERQLPLLRLVNLLGSPVLNHVQSLTFSTSETNPKFQRSNIFLNVK